MTPDGKTGAAVLFHPIPGSQGVPVVLALPPPPPHPSGTLSSVDSAPHPAPCSPRAAAPAAVCPGRGAVFTLTPDNGRCLGLRLPSIGGLLRFLGPLLASSSGCCLWVRCLRGVSPCLSFPEQSQVRGFLGAVPTWRWWWGGGSSRFGVPRCLLRGCGSAGCGERGTSAWRRGSCGAVGLRCVGALQRERAAPGLGGGKGGGGGRSGFLTWLLPR